MPITAEFTLDNASLVRAERTQSGGAGAREECALFKPSNRAESV